MADTKLYKIGITQGDINGIGYEVIIKALSEPKMTEICTSVVYGLAKVATYHRKTVDIPEFSFQFIKSVEQANAKKINLINLSDSEIKIDLGSSTDIGSKMALLSLTAACKDLKDRKIDAIVTAPVNKHNVRSQYAEFSGHTEFMAQSCNLRDSMMMMISDELKIGFATNHLPLSKVAETLSKELIINKLKILRKAMTKDFGITNPTIAVLSLNPHNSDQGMLGSEEKNIIQPAIEHAFTQGGNVLGPFAADSFFGLGQYAKFDAVLAMYHDQGMLPFKFLSRGEGVNFTAGLPIVRTSPVHGTAYEIAGKNVASAQSMRNAIYLAVDILNKRNSI